MKRIIVFGRRCWYRSPACRAGVPTTIVRVAVGGPYAKGCPTHHSGPGYVEAEKMLTKK